MATAPAATTAVAAAPASRARRTAGLAFDPDIALLDFLKLRRMGSLRAGWGSADVDVGLRRRGHAVTEEEAGVRRLVVRGVLPRDRHAVLGVVHQGVEPPVGLHG